MTYLLNTCPFPWPIKIDYLDANRSQPVRIRRTGLVDALSEDDAVVSTCEVDLKFIWDEKPRIFQPDASQ